MPRALVAARLSELFEIAVVRMRELLTMGRYVRARTNRSMQVQGSSAGPSHGGVIMQFLRLALVCSLLAPTCIHAAGFAHNDNFIVFTPDDPTEFEGQRLAELVLRRADASRAEIAMDWLGIHLPRGAGRTTIYVELSDAEDTGFTWAKDHPDRKLHTIYLTTSRENAAGNTLHHEIAHAVLATRYPHPNRLPTWLEEGIASRYDDRGTRLARQQIIDSWATSHRGPRLARLLEQPTMGMYDNNAYAAAVSLVSFLLTQGDRETLLKFGEDGANIGWDASLRKHYGIDNVPDLQAQWEGWLGMSRNTAQNSRSRSKPGAHLVLGHVNRSR
jgi:hypothetical protein